TFNEFEGMGGDDTIIGNGNTRVTYVNALAGVTVDLSGLDGAQHAGTAFGTVAGDAANVGLDTLTGGFSQIRGSQFGDTLDGSNASETLDGQAGADHLNGGGGNDRLIGGSGDDSIDGGAGLDIAQFTGGISQYTITPIGAGSSTVQDNTANRDGTDSLTGVE